MIVFAEEALDTALEHLGKIKSAVDILEEHSEIGRLCEAGSTLRELIVSHGKSGYVALYEHSAAENLVRVLAIRHQREAGYRGR